MNNILYVMGDKLYINLTNRCPCSCTFCLRNTKDKLGDADCLWLRDGEPSVEEVISQLKQRDLNKYEEIVFCGFGEPLVRIDAVCEIARFVKSVTKTPIKINTNGLADMVHKRDTASELEGIVDGVSISLNASNKEEYLKITNSIFGIDSFDHMLKFAKNAKKYVHTVVFTVVDVIGDEEIERSRKVAESVGVELRVRKYVE